MHVAQLGIDRENNRPVVLLREVDGTRVLPIIIGPYEANAIAMELQGQRPERPLTHDLLKRVILGLGVELRRVVITGVRESIYLAELTLVRGDQVTQVDARPSDSIALALRCHALIFANELLLDPEAQTGPEFGTDPSADPSFLREYLEKLDPQDFGRFKP